MLALTLNGDKRFPLRKVLMQFSRHACGLPNRVATAVVERVLERVRKAAAQMRVYKQAHPDFGEAAMRLLETYGAGLRGLVE